MKNKASFWTVIGISISAAISATSKNIPAGLFIGAGTSMLLMILTNLEADKKIRN
ncbi:MAG: hypothetical protein Q8941_20380 [Bacteroidota bacterium]|nr:hypothetical protein [Bacteroidota bacterium]